MPASDLVNLSGLMDDAKCFALVRQHRWPEGVRCPACDSSSVIRDGCDDTQPHRQRYRCKACASRFDDLSGTVLAGHHQPLRVWVLCLYFMGLNLSNRQRECQKPGALRREWDCLVAKAPVQHRGPDLKYAVGAAGRPAHLPALVHAGTHQLVDGALGP